MTDPEGKWLINENDVESCVLLERVSNRKADSYVKLNVKMEDYYRIKDAEGGEADGKGKYYIRYCNNK